MNSNNDQEKARLRALSRQLSAAAGVLLMVFLLLIIVIGVVNAKGGDVSSIGYYGVVVPLIAVGVAATVWLVVLMRRMRSRK